MGNCLAGNIPSRTSHADRVIKHLARIGALEIRIDSKTPGIPGGA
jgi:hypothetical protein